VKPLFPWKLNRLNQIVGSVRDGLSLYVSKEISPHVVTESFVPVVWRYSCTRVSVLKRPKYIQFRRILKKAAA
jgi:hypothetical protein